VAAADGEHLVGGPEMMRRKTFGKMRIHLLMVLTRVVVGALAQALVSRTMRARGFGVGV